MYNNPSPQYQIIFCTGYITLNVSGFLISHYSGFYQFIILGFQVSLLD